MANIVCKNICKQEYIRARIVKMLHFANTFCEISTFNLFKLRPKNDMTFQLVKSFLQI